MKNQILVNLIKNKNLVIPMYLFKLKNKLNLNTDEFIILMYLYNEGDTVKFNVEEIEKNLGYQKKDIMAYIGSLSDKQLIIFNTKKNDKGIIEEIITLDNFYNKISLFLMDEKGDTTSNIFSDIEREFGRTLSPIEYEIVKGWLENDMSEELVRCALEEAVMNGVSNLRYIDKILFMWAKKGIKNKEDVEKNRLEHRKKENKEKVEIFDYNWLDDDENR